MSCTEKNERGTWVMGNEKIEKENIFKRVSQVSWNGQYCFLALKSRSRLVKWGQGICAKPQERSKEEINYIFKKQARREGTSGRRWIIAFLYTGNLCVSIRAD